MKKLLITLLLTTVAIQCMECPHGKSSDKEEELRDYKLLVQGSNILLVPTENLDFNINKLHIDDRSYLMSAASNKNTVKGIISLLVANGADVNEQDTNGWTALHNACFNGAPGIIEELILNGASVNSLTPQGLTPLHLAMYPDTKKGIEPTAQTAAFLEAIKKLKEKMNK